MRALSVQQPWAALIASGEKSVEVRTWDTSYRGPLLICAGGKWHKLGVELHGEKGERGVAACVVELVDVRPMTRKDLAAAGLPKDYPLPLEGAVYAWVLANPRPVEPMPIRGQLGLFTPPRAVVVRLAAA
jgi:hypothetical protein